jgi:hypothetical protein
LSKTNSIIEVNGNRYDALSGQLVQTGHKVKIHSHAPTKTVIDGFVLGSHHAKSHVKKSLAQAKSRAKVTSMDVHGRQQRSRTLMRQIVRKPAKAAHKPDDLSPHIKTRQPSPAKEFRAKTAVKHPHVKRFGYFVDPVQPSPASEITRHNKRAEVEVLPQVPAMPSLVTSASHKKLEKMLDQALISAEAHRQMMNASRHNSFINKLSGVPRWLKFAVVAAFISIVALFLIWQNLPAVAVHVAAAKAHVNASIPAYTPEGFAYTGQLKYVPGAVTMEFKDKKHDQGSFSLTQTASNLSGQSLEDQALPKETPVQTSEVKGTTVYIYGHSSALWANRNVLYKLDNRADLTSDQVLKIVQSL